MASYHVESPPASAVQQQYQTVSSATERTALTAKLPNMYLLRLLLILTAQAFHTRVRATAQTIPDVWCRGEEYVPFNAPLLTFRQSPTDR